MSTPLDPFDSGSGEGEPTPSDGLDWDAITASVRAALSGELVVLATDTVYGIAARPDDGSATGKIFTAKARDRARTLPVLVASEEQARRVGVFDAVAERLVGSVWPGTVTLVLRRSPAALGWDLGGDAETVGLRIPDHPACRAVLHRSGPLAVSSANRSGRPTPRTCSEVHDVFGDEVAAYLCDRGRSAVSASTVVDLAHGKPTVLRAGTFDPERLAALLNG
ncbi:MAG: L-threonylcarbamoyladenylate synthase [Actinomycetota bacterium]